MKKNYLKLTVILPLSMAVFTMVGFTGLAFSDVLGVNADTKKAAKRMGAASVTEISFAKESSDLSESAKSEIKQFIESTYKNGQIKEVRVAAWSDQEYPRKKTKLAQSQIDLASRRADIVQSFLESTMSVSNVRTINMALRPNQVQEMLETPSAQTKNTLEKTGAAPTGTDQTGFLGLKEKASEAVLMVYLE